jgi:FIST N domain
MWRLAPSISLRTRLETILKTKTGNPLSRLWGAPSTSDSGSVVLLFATEQAKPNLAQFVTSFGERENVEVLGAVASSVTSLHIPRVFLATASASGSVAPVERYSSGVAGLVLKGNVCVETVVARSCLPVGPTFTVKEVAGPGNREILTMTVSDIGLINSNMSL